MNGRRPERSWNSTQPAAYTSVLASAGPPFACSGDRYAGVPNTTPARVSVSAIGPESAFSRNFTIPKSRSLT